MNEDDTILNLCETPWSGIYKRAFLTENDIRFNDLICVNDRSFFAEVITKAKRIMAVRNTVVIHRVNLSTSLVGNRANHFDCQMQSIRLIDEMLRKTDVNAEIKEKIMKAEFDDLMAWCRKFSNQKPDGKNILKQTEGFLMDYDYLFIAEMKTRLSNIKKIARQKERARLYRAMKKKAKRFLKHVFPI